jgi:hypothetical protein
VEGREKYRYGPRAFMVPAPPAFSLAPLSSALEDHATLLDRARETLVFANRGILEDDRCPSVLAGFAGRKADGEPVEMLLPRNSLMRWAHKVHGVRRALFAPPEERDALSVVVSSSDVISLQLLRVELRPGGKAPRLTVRQRGVVVEPARQTHWETGPWTVTQWLEPGEGTESRYAWSATPREPRNESEVIEQLVGFYEERIGREIRKGLRLGAVGEVLVFVGSTECCGDYVDCFDRFKLAEMTDYPTIARAIAEDQRSGHVPVFVMAERYGGLCWVSVGEDGSTRLDPRPTLVAEAVGLVDPDETDRFCRAGQSDPPPTGWPGVEGTIDRLVTLSPAELDAEIRRAGFDPTIERSNGPGLRESVVAGIAAAP